MQACKLVPAAVVRQVLGPLAAPPHENGRAICLYTKAKTGSLVSLVVTGLSTYTFVKQADTQIAKKETLKLQETHGIGDDAFAALVPAGPSYTLNAAKGKLAIAIHVDSGSAQDEQQVRELIVSAISDPSRPGRPASGARPADGQAPAGDMASSLLRRGSTRTCTSIPARLPA